MGCVSPQLLISSLGSREEVPCDICSGCIQVRAKLNRERQRAWFDRMKGRFHHG